VAHGDLFVQVLILRLAERGWGLRREANLAF
jgi:hypothetical protein